VVYLKKKHPMGTRFSWLLILSILPFYVYGQSHRPKPEVAIDQIMKVQEDAWNRGDIAGFMEAYLKSDELKFIGKSGLTKGYDRTLANYKKSYSDPAAMGRLTFTNIHMERIGRQVYFVIGSWKLERSAELGNLSGYYSLIWRKIKGRWVIVADHSS
jgi:ketosteroid isomerase-like protein